jgi:hypothetical protein
MYKQFIDTPHLIFQIHDTQADGPLDFPGQDILVLRGLAERYAAIASLPVQEERRRSWKRLNDLEPERPLIWVNEVCWNEMDHDGSLQIRSTNEVCQRIETELRRTIYQWQQFPGDMIVEPVFYSPLILRNTGFGISPVTDVAVIDPTSESPPPLSQPASWRGGSGEDPDPANQLRRPAPPSSGGISARF